MLGKNQEQDKRDMGKGHVLTWTKEKPTTPGWYWNRVEGSRMFKVSLVNEDHDGQLYVREAIDFFHITYIKSVKNFEWAGPLPEPEETDDR